MNTYKILALINGANINITDELKKAKEYFASRPIPIDVEFTTRNINIPLEWVVFKVVQGFSSQTGRPIAVKYFGLAESVKNNVRSLVKEFKYSEVMIVNDISSIPVKEGEMYSVNWTNYNPLYFNTGFVQIVWNPYLKQTGEVASALIHEPMHDFCFTLNRYGIKVIDEMDVDHLGRPYYRNDFPNDPNSNFGFTYENIKPYINNLVPKQEKEMYKPKNFALKELVSPEILAKYGDKAWEFLDERMLRNIQFIRDSLGRPIIVNNGSTFTHRCFDATEERKDGTSQHNMGRAIDFDVKGMSAEQVRKWMGSNYKNFPEPNIWVEIGTNWVHFDVRYSDKSGIYLFQP